jgi:protein-tyrosine phosphatase
VKKKVLFVCLGNICRSPAAEGVFRTLVEKANLSHRFEIDSAGTLNHHEGEQADPRMRQHAQQRGFSLTSIARGIRPEDLSRFDHIITMDHSNYEDVKAMANLSEQHKILPMTSFLQKLSHDHVPDPYYGGPEGFELVLDILEEACAGLLKKLKQEL